MYLDGSNVSIKLKHLIKDGKRFGKEPKEVRHSSLPFGSGLVFSSYPSTPARPSTQPHLSNHTPINRFVMASTFALRRFALTAARPTRSFHSSTRVLIKVGDKLPELNSVLVENSPGNKVDVSELATGKALLIGVPAAFSKSPFFIVDKLQAICFIFDDDFVRLPC